MIDNDDSEVDNMAEQIKSKLSKLKGGADQKRSKIPPPAQTQPAAPGTFRPFGLDLNPASSLYQELSHPASNENRQLTAPPQPRQQSPPTSSPQPPQQAPPTASQRPRKLTASPPVQKPFAPEAEQNFLTGSSVSRNSMSLDEQTGRVLISPKSNNSGAQLRSGVATQQKNPSSLLIATNKSPNPRKSNGKGNRWKALKKEKAEKRAGCYELRLFVVVCVCPVWMVFCFLFL